MFEFGFLLLVPVIVFGDYTKRLCQRERNRISSSYIVRGGNRVCE